MSTTSNIMPRLKRIMIGHTSFLENLDGRSISNYFGVPGCYSYALRDESVYFSVRYEQLPRVGHIEGLPTEISVHIASYLYEFKTCMFKIDFPAPYPFHPSIWTALRMKNLQGHDIARCLNEKYRLSWSPAFGIEKDILNMVCVLTEG